ncbi:MAG: hypothetical protein QM756_47365 [Polyangiaceae bacterium]
MDRARAAAHLGQRLARFVLDEDSDIHGFGQALGRRRALGRVIPNQREMLGDEAPRLLQVEAVL